MKNLPLAAYCIFVASSICVAQDEIALSFSLPQQGTTSSFVDGITGFDFTPEATLTVSGLGWYDQDGDGLLNDHPIAIYETNTQTELAMTTVTSISSLDGSNYRFEDIAPLTLDAGTTYTVAAFTSGPQFDPEVVNPDGGIVFGDGFAFNRLRQDLTNGLQFPSQSGEDGATQLFFLSANFRYSNVAPEPPLTGDFDADGDVDALDIDFYAGNLGLPATGDLAMLCLLYTSPSPRDS